MNHDGIFSLKNLYYTTEELWFPEWEFGLPWLSDQGGGTGGGTGTGTGAGAGAGAGVEAGEGGTSSYTRYSPDAYVHRWSTPCLGKSFSIRHPRLL